MTQPFAAPATVNTAEVESARRFLDLLFPPPRDFAVRLWEGTLVGGENGTRYTLVMKSPGALRRMVTLPLETGMGEAFFRDDFDIEGDFFAAFDLIPALKRVARKPGDLLTLARLRRRLPKDPAPIASNGRGPAYLSGARATRGRDRAAIQYHYDVGNDFYSLWLDRRMVYSCAYFPTGAEDLDTAQEHKLDYICRKLRLEAGERFLDIGCGWGGLLIHAAQNFRVHAVGVTLSEQQHQFATQRIEALGLSGRVVVKLMDYRDLSGERFDKIASIAMFEAVGRKHPEYFPLMYSLLRPGGLFLNHSIAAHTQAEPWVNHSLPKWIFRRFVVGSGLIRERYVFPDGELVPLSEANLLAEQAGFEVRDVENLREHYALTLRHWVSRLEARHDEAVRVADESVFRIWRLYMAASALEFEAGSINLNQTLFARPLPGHRSVPLSRADLYR